MAIDISFVAIATEFLTAVTQELDAYSSKKGQIIVTNDLEIVLLTPAHIQFARYGRGPGKKPPLDSILAWVREDGIIFSGLTEKGTAQAIQASIGYKGTHNWEPNAPNFLEQTIQGNSGEFNKKLNNTLVIELRDQFEKEYQKLFPPQMDFQI